MTRRIERLGLRILLWLFALTEMPHIDEASPDCPCSRCILKRQKRRKV